MSCLRLLLFFVCLALAGCHPPSQATGDEQKEPYFLAAKKKAQERDVQGAIDYFEKALDVNPHSASAHIELAILYEREQADWAAALYHYKRGLELRPDYPTADIIKGHIEECKRELAKSVVQLPSVEALQRKLDTVTAENQQLKQQLQAWQTYYAAHGVTSISNLPPATDQVRQPAAPQQTGTLRTDAVPPAHTDTVSRAGMGAPPATARTYTVGPGDTLDRIARRYGVKLSALQSANPTVDARRLRPGQVLTIPATSQ